MEEQVKENLTIRIESNLKRQFKAKCRENDESLSGVIRRHIKKYIATEKNKQKEKTGK